MDEELKSVRDVLTAFRDYIRKIYRYNLTTEDVIATQSLYKNIPIQVKKGKKSYIVNLKLEEYWKYIQYERNPGKFPTVDKIINRITAKPVIVFENEMGKIPFEISLAFLIGHKITRKGIEPGPLLKESVNEVLDVYYSKIAKALQNVIQDILYADINRQFRSSNFKHITFK